MTGAGGPCSFCGTSRGPVARVAGQFTVLVCISCLAWLERQAGAAQQLLAERPADGQDR